MKKVLPLFIKILLIHFFVFFYSHAKAEVTITALIAETGPVSNIAQTIIEAKRVVQETINACLLYTSPSPRDATLSRMPSSA